MREKDARVIVSVDWVDAQIIMGELEDEQPSPGLAHVRSCGWLVEDEPDYIKIGMDRFENQFRTTQTIAKINIKSIRYFYPNKGRPTKAASGKAERILRIADGGVALLAHKL